MRLQDSTAACGAAGTAQSSPSAAKQTVLKAAWSALGRSGQSGGLDALVQALRATLSAGLSAGRDAAGELSKSLDQALSAAQQTLVNYGVDPHRAAHHVADFRRSLSRAVHLAAQAASAAQSGAVGAPAPAALPGPITSPGAVVTPGAVITPASQAGVTSQPAASTPSATVGIGGAVSLRESLQIVTSDGVRVGVRFSEQDLFAVGSAQSADGSSSTSAALSRGRIEISVQGNLSADDLKAVDALVSQVDALAQQFFSGDLQDAFNSAAALGSQPSQIAQFSLHLSYARIGVVGVVSEAPPAAQASQVPASTPASAGAPDAGSSGTTSPADSSSGADSSAGSTDPTSANGSASPSGSDSAQQTIGNFIQDVLGKLASVSGTARLTFSMKWKLELLASALPAYAPTTQSAAAPGTQLASSTLESLAN